MAESVTTQAKQAGFRTTLSSDLTRIFDEVIHYIFAKTASQETAAKGELEEFGEIFTPFSEFFLSLYKRQATDKNTITQLQNLFEAIEEVLGGKIAMLESLASKADSAKARLAAAITIADVG